MDLTLQERLRLIAFFEFLLDEEVSKPLGEMNSEATDSYIKILLYLQDKHVKLSPEFINEQVRKIFPTEETIAAPETAQTTKKRYSKKKIWLVAACIAILVALFSIISFSSERGVADMLENFFGSFEFIPYGKGITVDDETYIKDAKTKIYKSPEDFVKCEKIDILYPTNIPDTLDHISVDNTDNVKEILIYYNDVSKNIRITPKPEIPKEIKNFCNERLTINGIEYHLCIMDDVNMVQAYFIHNNNIYEFIYTDKDELIKILNSMEEIKYEN